MTPRTFVLWDTLEDRRYLNVVYTSAREAMQERAGLLKGYPVGHEWRERLVVREVGAPVPKRSKYDGTRERQRLKREEIADVLAPTDRVVVSG